VVRKLTSTRSRILFRKTWKDLNHVQRNGVVNSKTKHNNFGQEFGTTVGQKGQQFGTEAAYVAKSSGSRIGNAIGIMFKAFFLFVAGIIAFALLVALIAADGAGVGVFPLKDFFLEGVWQNVLAWLTLLLFLGVPVVAFITWVIRRIMGVKSGNKYLGFTFAGLWVIGLVSGGILAASIARNFDAAAKDKQEYHHITTRYRKTDRECSRYQSESIRPLV
jgi:ABC-type multidrug transport system fused ATPase/permease subunit